MKKILSSIILTAALCAQAQFSLVRPSQEPPTNGILPGDLLILGKYPGTASEKIYKVTAVDFVNAMRTNGLVGTIDMNYASNQLNAHIATVENAATALATRAANLEGATNGLSTNVLNHATLFVDVVHGNDSSAQRDNPAKPWQTISNALASSLNGDTIRLAPGTYTNRTINGGGAPLLLLSRTNFSILGAGANTRIYSDVTNESSMLIVSNCTGLQIKGVVFEGTRIAPPNLRKGYYSMIEMDGANSNVEVSSCQFLNYMGHGIIHVVNDNGVGLGVHDLHFMVHDNYFFNIGSTNIIDTGSDDGACLILRSDSLIYNNIFDFCNRGVEWENSSLDNSGTILSGNIFKRMWTACFYGLTDAVAPGASVNFYHSIVISGNSFHMLYTNVFQNNSAAIIWTGGGQVSVADNLFLDCSTGVSISDNATNVDRVLIRGNQFSQCYDPIIIEHATTNYIRDMVISGNSFDNCADRVELQGIQNLVYANNQHVNLGTVTAASAIIVRDSTSVAGAIKGISTNLLFQGNSFYANSGTTSEGILIMPGIRNCRMIDNWFGPGVGTNIDFRGSGEILQSADVLGIGTAVTPALSFTLATNSAAFCQMEATGISTNAFDAAAFQLYATFRNTNGFTSNLVAGAHSYIFTNSTDAGFYTDVTNAGGNTINFVVGGSSGKNVNWRTRCRATIIAK